MAWIPSWNSENSAMTVPELVMDFMDTDLEIVIKDERLVLTPAHIKSYTLQTLLGLEYLHDNWVRIQG